VSDAQLVQCRVRRRCPPAAAPTPKPNAKAKRLATNPGRDNPSLVDNIDAKKP